MGGSSSKSTSNVDNSVRQYSKSSQSNESSTKNISNITNEVAMSVSTSASSDINANLVQENNLSISSQGCPGQVITIKGITQKNEGTVNAEVKTMLEIKTSMETKFNNSMNNAMKSFTDAKNQQELSSLVETMTGQAKDVVNNLVKSASNSVNSATNGIFSIGGNKADNTNNVKTTVDMINIQDQTTKTELYNSMTETNKNVANTITNLIAAITANIKQSNRLAIAGGQCTNIEDITQSNMANAVLKAMSDGKVAAAIDSDFKKTVKNVVDATQTLENRQIIGDLAVLLTALNPTKLLTYALIFGVVIFCFFIIPKIFSFMFSRKSSIPQITYMSPPRGSQYNYPPPNYYSKYSNTSSYYNSKYKSITLSPTSMS